MDLNRMIHWMLLKVYLLTLVIIILIKIQDFCVNCLINRKHRERSDPAYLDSWVENISLAFTMTYRISFVLVTVLYLSSTTTAFMQSSLYRDSQTKYGKFKRNHNQSLLVSITESLFVEDASDCSFSCVGDPKCLSYNIAKSPDSNGIYVCEVLATDMYRAKDRLKANSNFHHFSPMVSG